MADSELFTTLISSAFDAGIVPARNSLQRPPTSKTLRNVSPRGHVFAVRPLSVSGDDAESLAGRAKVEITQNLVGNDGMNDGKRFHGMFS